MAFRKGSRDEHPDPPGGQPTSAARAQTLPLQGLVNRVNRGLLRTPLLCRLVGRRLLTVYLAGRKSGRHYAVPVACTRRNGTLLVGTQSAWARNLRTGEPVHIRLAGKRPSADVHVVATLAPTTFTSRGPQAPESPSGHRCDHGAVL